MKKLTLDMGRVQEKLANAYHEGKVKDKKLAEYEWEVRDGGTEVFVDIEER